MPYDNGGMSEQDIRNLERNHAEGNRKLVRDLRAQVSNLEGQVSRLGAALDSAREENSMREDL